MENNKNVVESGAKDLLIEDHRYLAESFWKNEQTGETRVNWFIGIVTASVGGLVGLANAGNGIQGETLRLVVISCLTALLVIGFMTWLRVKKRNDITDGYKKDFDTIREIFRAHFDGQGVLREYSPFGPKLRVQGSGVSEGRKFGGLADLVYGINSLLIAGLAGTLVYPAGKASAILGSDLLPVYASVLSLILLLFAFRFWPRLTHAGGVVYKIVGGIPYYLLVASKNNTSDEWLLPKGHIKPWEEAFETAIRETHEETGTFAGIVAEIGTIPLKIKKKRIKTKFFLMQELREGESPEFRGKRWSSYEDALKELEFPESKNILERGEKVRLMLDQTKRFPTQSQSTNLPSKGP